MLFSVGVLFWGSSLAASAFAPPEPAGLLFHASFDSRTADADWAQGDGRSRLDVAPDRVWPEGVKGYGLLQQPGERCGYPLAGNLDTRQGTFSIWIKPLNWDGDRGQFRHFLVVQKWPEYSLYTYLYPIADKALFQYLQLDAGSPKSATWRAGTGVEVLQRNRWIHLASTWDSQAVRLYVNGRRAGEGLVSRPLPLLDTGEFLICPIEFWQNQWSDPHEQTVCDEVRIFDHPLSDEEILDLYARDVPGGVPDLQPTLAVSMEPAAKRIHLTLRPAHLDAGWFQRLAEGGTVALSLRDPQGHLLFDQELPLDQGPLKRSIPVPEWLDGDYVASATLQAGRQELAGQATLTKPPTPWLPALMDWRADRVLEPWKPLVRQGDKLLYWGGQVVLDGALPTQITHQGAPLLAGPIRLAADQEATWTVPQGLEEQPYRLTFQGSGRLGKLSISYQTLMEFDGLIRVDLTLTPPVEGWELDALTLEIPLQAEVAIFYRNPTCQEWDGTFLEEKNFLPYAWLGHEKRGLSWFMESDANQVRQDGAPAMTFQREGQTVWVRLHWIRQKVRLTQPLTYTIGFEPTPVRPLPGDLYDQWFASGPQIQGSNLFVYGWGQQLSTLNGRLIASNPAEQRRLVDQWRAQGKESLSYTCTQITADISPEYRFFGREWNLPYGDTFSGYRRVPDNASYSLVPVCPASSFADFLVWCVRENLRNDWGGGIYTDIDGLFPCDNPRHGCGYTDAFGRTGRTFPIYAHRALSRRIYAACHDVGRRYFSHQHSRWYAPFNVFNDGWCPGEQYSLALIGKPFFYMEDIPDRVWRSEFYSPTTGVPTFLLPELGRLSPGENPANERGPSESCLVAALAYGVPLWASSIHQAVVEEVWAVQQAFGLKEASFVPFWEQREIVASDPDIRISAWRKPGQRLVVVANFTDRDRPVELKLAPPNPNAQIQPAWKATDLIVEGGTARLTLPAWNGVLLTVAGLDQEGAP